MVAVYGVQLPGHEGRAGMASLELKSGMKFDGQALYVAVEQNLFPAARPLFVRLVERLEVTSSMKVIKHTLQEEGADPSNISDPLYCWDAKEERYSPMGKEEYVNMLASVV